MQKNILVIQGNPKPQSLCQALAQSYQQGAAEGGALVRNIELANLTFSPFMTAEDDAALEDDLVNVQSQLHWANHVALVYPNWWGGAPGLLKIMLERTLLPGFAFKYHAKGNGWDRLLKGRSSELIVTMDSPPFLYKWAFGAAGDRIMMYRTLDFCGLKPVRATHFGPVRSSDANRRNQWMEQSKALGLKAAKA